MSSSQEVKLNRVVSSEVFQTVYSTGLDSLQRICAGNPEHERMLYPFLNSGLSRHTIRTKHETGGDMVILEGYNLQFTNGTILRLLKKAVDITSETDEGVIYNLHTVFGSGKKFNGPPPGSLRFYSNKLICFWTGKNWRRITP